MIPPSPIFNVIEIYGTKLLLNGPVIFSNIDDNDGDGCIIAMVNSIITVYHYVEFSHNNAFGIIMYHCAVELDRCYIMNIIDNTILNITNNTLETFFSVEVTNHLFRIPFYPPCFFQYLSSNDRIKANLIFSGNSYRELHYHHLLYDIANRPVLRFSLYHIYITHCYWLQKSAFNTTIPMEINNQFIYYNNNSALKLTKGNTLCYCVDEIQYDCYKEELGSIYPGQTLTVPLYACLNFTFSTDIIAEKRNETYITSCLVSKPTELIQHIGRNCTLLKYTIEFPTNEFEWCELFLKVPQTKFMEYSIFYIRQLRCPLGFVKINGTCQCYPMFTKFGFTKCDINRQAILRPPNGWIYLLHNKSHSYYVSQQCPLSYCSPYSKYVHLSTPDTQCQFNRTGILCGHCQHGLSTVFGSNQCKQCSNIFLLLVIPFIIAGILVILLLFLFNLTVNNGSANPYIVYVNILSINGALLFPKFEQRTPVYTIVSLANFDLGIITCFYNGMDDYAKVWLQLVFPCYLILLTITLITASYYSSKVYRFTAQRGLAVLATIVLLSYTKILCTVSSVLFNYSSITHLPSNKTMHVWAVDANVSLLSGRFIALFILCAILFVMLLLFSTMLLLGKSLQKFGIVRKLKPLLDAYQRPYKAKFYYWTGLQLVFRVALFSISSLSRNSRLITNIIIIYIISILHGSCKPFRNMIDNYQEYFLIVNLLVLHILMISGVSAVSSIITIVIALAIIQFGVSHIIFYLIRNSVKQKILLWIKTNSEHCYRKVKK